MSTKTKPAFSKFYIATDCDSTFNTFNDAYYSASGASPEEAVAEFKELHDSQPKFVYEVTKRFVVKTEFVEG
jgi:hypothetical protein